MRGIVAKFSDTSARGAACLCIAFIALCTLFLLSGCAWWDNKERELVYRPTPGKPADFPGLKPGDETYFVQLPADTSASTRDKPQQLQFWWMPQANPKAPSLLYLHGTFRNLYKNLPKIEALRDAGFSVLAVDYRGWGESSFIVPSEKTILEDANSAWAELVRRQSDPRKRVIFGHSMGGGVAISLASRKLYLVDYAGLITESTFTDLPDVAAAAGVLGTIGSWITRQSFDSVGKIGQVDAPILMMHGELDKTVPVALGRKLRDAARPGLVHWVEFAGGSHSRLHSEQPEAYRQAVKSVVDGLPKPTPPKNP